MTERREETMKAMREANALLQKAYQRLLHPEGKTDTKVVMPALDAAAGAVARAVYEMEYEVGYAPFKP